MNARNSVNRILINPDSPVEEELDRCLIETEFGDVFALLCFPITGKPGHYRVTIYKTDVHVDDRASGKDSNYIASIADTAQPVYVQSFYAANSMFKRGMLSNMLECIQQDDANTWDSLKKEFGCENASAVHGYHGQIGIC